MGKWLAGILGALITGSALWLLTTFLFPRLFKDDPLPVPPDVRITCTPVPSMVQAGEETELQISVTYNGEPVEGAPVSFTPNDYSQAGMTVSGGMYRHPWRAPLPAAKSYVFPVSTVFEGVRTSSGELSGSATTDCLVNTK